MSTSRLQNVIYIIGFLDLAGASVMLPHLLPRITALTASHFTAGCVSSLYGAIQLFSSPLMGWSSDVVGRRSVLLVCTVATAAGFLTLGSSQSLLVLVLARTIAGIFKHSQTLCRAVLADVTPASERSRVFGKFNATSSMGFIVGPMLGGHISELENGFFCICIVGASLFTLIFVLCWIFIPNIASAKEKTKEQERNGRSISLRRDVDWSVLWDIFLVRFFLSFSSLVYRSNFSLLVNQNFGASPRVIGYLISFQGIVSALAGFFTGHISRFYANSHRELFDGSVLLTMALLGLTVAPSLSLLVLCLIPLCISTAVIRVSGSAITIARCQPSMVGSVTGLGQSIASTARMITPVVAGLAQEATVYGPGAAGTLSAGIGAALVRYMMHKAKFKKE